MNWLGSSMGSLNRASAGDAAPLYATARNPNRETLGPEVAQILAVADRKRIDPMPWQRQVLDVACEIDPRTGLYWYRKVIVIVPRQAGKTTMTRGKLTHRALSWEGANMMYTAQDRNMARRRLQKTIYQPLKRSLLAPTLGKPNWQNGQEAVNWKNGSELIIISNSETSGHGDTLHEVHVDEAFAHRDSHIEQNVSPTMITVQGSQLWTTSAAGGLNSHYLAGKVELGRALVQANDPSSRVCYIEYSAPLDADREDPRTWLMCHPAIGYTIQAEDIRAELDAMASNPAEFDRAYLGWWPSGQAEETVIPRAAWYANFVDPAMPTWRGMPTWSVDVSPDRSWASIGLAAQSYNPESRAFVEVIDHMQEGTGWIVARLRDLRARFGGFRVILDGSGSATSLIEDLEADGWTVDKVTAREKADACGGLYDDALQHRVHYLDDDVLNTAMTSATKVNAYGGEAWIFNRGKSRADITPLYAVTLARYGHVKYFVGDPLSQLG
jgi:Phage Terminase